MYLGLSASRCRDLAFVVMTTLIGSKNNVRYTLGNETMDVSNGTVEGELFVDGWSHCVDVYNEGSGLILVPGKFSKEFYLRTASLSKTDQIPCASVYSAS